MLDCSPTLLTREAWVSETQSQYWTELPLAEREALAGGLWDRNQRLAQRRARKKVARS